ncbi:hypothetical protein RclHR1_00500030 [Rhizophagus clarus]|nr:hypothetical protein RclHR1_00500030 [Rhizophagus clarus]
MPKEREVNMIESDLCPRCKEESENWEHVWICEDNEVTIRETIDEAIDKYEQKLKQEERTEDSDSMQQIYIDLRTILYENSIIIQDKSREWEMLRGISNNRFHKISRKNVKNLIKELWEDCYEHLRTKIWKRRCDIVNEMKKIKGITKKDKKKRKMETTEKEGNIEKNKKTKENNSKNPEKNLLEKIKLVTKDKILDRVTNDHSIKNNWSNVLKLPN